MQPIELRQNKASMSCMLWLFGLVAAGIFIYLFFSRRTDFTPVKVFLLLFACLIAFVVWRTTTQLKRNKPLLVFLREGLEINETAQPVMVLWQDVKSWDIRKQGATHYLTIQTAAKRYSINISWLQVKPEEVKVLMTRFAEPTGNYQ